MKLLFDQNISFRILKLLPDSFKESSHISNEGLTNLDDRGIWDFARLNKFTIVTQDSDFNDLTNLHGFPPKVIWLKIGNRSTNAISELIIKHKDEIDAFISDSNHGCFIINSLKKLGSRY